MQVKNLFCEVVVCGKHLGVVGAQLLCGCWVKKGLNVERFGFVLHWFKLCIIAVVILWATHLCHVYSKCLFFFLPC